MTDMVMARVCGELEAENRRLRSAITRIRNSLHAHNRPDIPLSNKKRIALRDLADLALETEVNSGERDAARCEVDYSKGVAGNITEAADEIERLNREVRSTEQQMAILHADKDMEIERLSAAIMLTIEENLHLADGDDCTLRHLTALNIHKQGSKGG